MRQNHIAIIVKKEDAEFIAKAIEHYQKTLNIKKYNIRFGINGLRMIFEEISQTNKSHSTKSNIAHKIS